MRTRICPLCFPYCVAVYSCNSCTLALVASRVLLKSARQDSSTPGEVLFMRVEKSEFQFFFIHWRVLASSQTIPCGFILV